MGKFLSDRKDKKTSSRLTSDNQVFDYTKENIVLKGKLIKNLENSVEQFLAIYPDY